MNIEPSMWSFITHAGLIVKSILLILLLASIISWTVIIQRFKSLKSSKINLKKFEKRFWSGTNLEQLFTELTEKKSSLSGLAHIFQAGFQEFLRLRQQSTITPEAIMEGTQRAMRVVQAREIDLLERNLSVLATIGSTAPYVGLFGTVWGIMTSLRALGSVQQATISMVAPGVSEALIATAIGLLVAIPAVVTYNRLTNELERLMNHYDTFQDELSGILHRQIHMEKIRHTS